MTWRRFNCRLIIYLAVSINAMDLKERLRDIGTDCRDCLHV
jgi:hypothetical protein